MIHLDPANVALDPPPADPHAPARALIDAQLIMLTRLAEIGMAIAEAAGQAATALQSLEAHAHHDPGLTYARAARAVRLTIALQSRLMKDLAELDRAEALALATRATARRRCIHHIVEQAIEAEHDRDDDEIERLSSDAWERLTDEDDADLTERPLAEIVAAICADLGLSPDWAAEAFGGASPGAEHPPRPPRTNLGVADTPSPGPIPIDPTSLRLAAQPRAPPEPRRASRP